MPISRSVDEELGLFSNEAAASTRIDDLVLGVLDSKIEYKIDRKLECPFLDICRTSSRSAEQILVRTKWNE